MISKVVLMVWKNVLAVAVVTLSLPVDGDDLKQDVIGAMSRATQFFRSEIATEGGYLWQYSEDLSMRQGEGRATDTVIWIQPPGTPEVGMVFLDAYAATGDTT